MPGKKVSNRWVVDRHGVVVCETNIQMLARRRIKSRFKYIHHLSKGDERLSSFLCRRLMSKSCATQSVDWARISPLRSGDARTHQLVAKVL